MKRFASIVLLQIALLFVGLAIKLFSFALRGAERLAQSARARLAELRRSRMRLVGRVQSRADVQLTKLGFLRDQEALKSMAASAAAKRAVLEGKSDEAQDHAKRAFRHWKAERAYGRWIRHILEEAA